MPFIVFACFALIVACIILGVRLNLRDRTIENLRDVVQARALEISDRDEVYADARSEITSPTLRTSIPKSALADDIRSLRKAKDALKSEVLEWREVWFSKVYKALNLSEACAYTRDEVIAKIRKLSTASVNETIRRAFLGDVEAFVKPTDVGAAAFDLLCDVRKELRIPKGAETVPACVDIRLTLERLASRESELMLHPQKLEQEKAALMLEKDQLTAHCEIMEQRCLALERQLAASVKRDPSTGRYVRNGGGGG